MKYEVLVASNVHARAKRERGRRAIELEVDCYYTVTRLVALGFGEGAFKVLTAPESVEVVLRSAIQEVQGDARVHATLGPVAVVPTKADVEALIAKRDDVGPRVVYLSSTCPLRLSWMH